MPGLHRGLADRDARVSPAPRRPRVHGAGGELVEAAFQRQVIGLARYYGWRVFHAPDNRPAGKGAHPQRLASPESRGFPDLVLVRDCELVFAELKSRTGRLGPGQQDWLDALNAVPTVTAVVWRPADLDSTIHDRLAQGRMRQERIA